MLTYLLGFLILLTIVVFIHEYGHYYFARKIRSRGYSFSVGFGQSYLVILINMARGGNFLLFLLEVM
jgi:membrane-associated protease RseP (regulator of RpoE activity)